MKLEIKRVLASASHEPQDGPLAKLLTPWGEALDPTDVLPEHPHPQMARARWTMLNGVWEYAIVGTSAAREQWRWAKPPKEMDGEIVVPFSPEAPLSGVRRQLQPDELLWYRRRIEMPARARGSRTILHFEAVDWACAVYVNGKRAGEHTGAYEPFALDVTELLEGREALVEVCVFDPSDVGTQLRGKQRLKRETMWYTAQSGIWQSVWAETVPAAHVRELRLAADADAGVLAIDAEVAGAGELAAELYADGSLVASAKAQAADGAARLEVELAEPRLWSPDDPFLYDVKLRFGKDELTSYCAFRSVGIEPDDAGVPRFCLNHEPLFLRGLLNQAYWSDGLLTAPSEEARLFDLERMRAHGFNMFRLHIKVETERWYYLCDKHGMLVWQDMPSGGGELSDWHTKNKPTLFPSSWGGFVDTTEGHIRALAAGDEAYRAEWLATCAATVSRLSSHPCIVSWVLFNESWGQFESAAAVELVRGIDATRPILATSGWYDQGAGDYLGVHNYFRAPQVFRDVKRRAAGLPDRAFVTSEFGGLTWHIPEHSSLPRPYGYASFGSLGEWRDGVESLLARASALEGEGMCGFVYTQVSDVEEETNGILTYDRRIDKMAE